MNRNFKYVVDIDGIVIPINTIQAISFKQFKSLSGMMCKLSSEAEANMNSPYSNMIYVLDLDDVVHVVDFQDDKNRQITYDTSFNLKTFLEEYANIKNNACIVSKQELL